MSNQHHHQQHPNMNLTSTLGGWWSRRKSMVVLWPNHLAVVCDKQGVCLLAPQGWGGRHPPGLFAVLVCSPPNRAAWLPWRAARTIARVVLYYKLLEIKSRLEQTAYIGSFFKIYILTFYPDCAIDIFHKRNPFGTRRCATCMCKFLFIWPITP